MSATTFYRAFEDRYRGARDVIKQRLAAYAPFLDALHTLGPRPTALDLGCGRGEWLELLGEAGIAARGVDLDAGMLAACHELGLDAELGDAIAALRACPDHSLSLVSAFHLVEHIPFDVLQTLIAEARRALRPGGLLIMETPNPENLSVGATSFYLDPSHEKPLPPLLLGFLSEFAGFARQRTVRLQEAPQLRDPAAPVGLIDVLEGVSPDYAIVAQSAAGAATLAPFDAAYALPFGCSLGELAQRYEQLRAGRHQEIHEALARQAGDVVTLNEQHAATQRQLGELHGALQQVERRTGEAEQRAAALQQQLEQTVRAAAEQTAAAQQQIIAMLNSSSWRMTAPWRLAGRIVYGVRARARRGLKPALLALMRAVLRQPLLKRGARALLARAPGLQARLRGLLQQPAGQGALPPEPPPAAGDLSPRAARIYDDLKKTLETRK